MLKLKLVETGARFQMASCLHGLGVAGLIKALSLQQSRGALCHVRSSPSPDAESSSSDSLPHTSACEARPCVPCALCDGEWQGLRVAVHESF